MELLIDFPGNAKVDAHFDGFTVHTDQPLMGGGDNSAPSPFSVFLASIGTCAGIYVLGFCRQRGLPTDGIRVLERVERSRTTGMVENIDLEIQVPPSFPAQYHDALVHTAELCAVKKHLENPPHFHTYTKVMQA
ncbi:MAG TPA: OsmC family protein [Longilinea sp.]|nr:OsmC family protein [Longilinea sp.]